MKLLLLLATTLLAINIASVDCTPTGIKPIHSLFVTPNNLRHHASYIDDSVTVGPRIIGVETGSTGERLIDIPIMSAGEFNRYTSVRITVSLNPSGGSDNKDPRFGITDGSFVNEFRVHGPSNTPCHLSSSGQSAASTGTPTRGIPAVATLTFIPFYRYGICSVTKDGGHTVVATFNDQLDLDKDISFRIRRDTSSEQYQFFYIMIETFEETF